MTLNFMTKWPNTMPEHLAGKPTYFIDKIWCGLCHLEVCQELADYMHSEHYSGKNIMDFKPKLHTIRFLDEKQLVKWLAPERNIHFKIWTGEPYHSKTLQFAPVLPLVSVQPITISFYNGIHYPNIRIAGKQLSHFSQVVKLAVNDGFDNVDDFFAYFSKELIEAKAKEGKLPYILHWTDLTY